MLLAFFSPFDCYVLDKCEGVLLGECGFSRRRADHLEIYVLLRSLGIEVLVVDPVVGVSRAELRPNAAIVGDGVADRLRNGSVDAVVVRMHDGAYEHYDPVVLFPGRPWLLRDDVSARICSLIVA